MNERVYLTSDACIVGINHHATTVPGEVLSFEREPDNRFDENAIAARNARGQMVWTVKSEEGQGND
jgi:hypothetical protein